MKQTLVFLLCFLVWFQTEIFGRSGGGGAHSGGSRISSSVRSASSLGARAGSRNASRINNSGAKGVRSFSKTAAPKSISRYVGKPFTKPKTVSTSIGGHRLVSYTYTRPVVFHNPYLTYYLLMNANHSGRHDSLRADTTAFPGFGKGKSGGAGASLTFADSLRKHLSKDTLEISELVPINYLSDYAGIVPDQDEAKINYLIRHYKKMTGVEMAVLTIPTLGNEIDLVDYAQVLFDKWGIGEAGVNNGVLIIISSEDEILRIQPGYGLEEFLPDAICREVEDNIMMPFCKEKQWEKAITMTVSDLIKRLGDKPVEIMKAELAAKQKKEDEEIKSDLSTCLKVIAGLGFIFLIWLFLIKRRY